MLQTPAWLLAPHKLLLTFAIPSRVWEGNVLKQKRGRGASCTQAQYQRVEHGSST